MISIGGPYQSLYNTSHQNNLTFVPTTLVSGASGSDGRASSTPPPLSGSGTPSYAFPTDSSGRPVVATPPDMQAAAAPGDKLTIAGNIAEALRMQSNACSGKPGGYHRVTEMADQLKTLLEAMTNVVDGLATTEDPAIPDQADPAVTPHQASMSKTLERVALVMASLQLQTSKAPPDVGSQAKNTLATVNKAAGTLAAQAGLDWPALSKAGIASLVSGTPAATPRLIDRLA